MVYNVALGTASAAVKLSHPRDFRGLLISQNVARLARQSEPTGPDGIEFKILAGHHTDATKVSLMQPNATPTLS